MKDEREALRKRMRDSIPNLTERAKTRRQVLKNIELSENEPDSRERFVATRPPAKLGDLGMICPAHIDANKVTLMQNTTKEKYLEILRDGLFRAEAYLDIHRSTGRRHLIKEFSEYVHRFSRELEREGGQE